MISHYISELASCSCPSVAGVDDGSWLDKKGPRKGKKTKEELEMERQERKAVKKYLEQEQRARAALPFKAVPRRVSLPC